jgi:hypothetical protein
VELNGRKFFLHKFCLDDLRLWHFLVKPWLKKLLWIVNFWSPILLEIPQYILDQPISFGIRLSCCVENNFEHLWAYQLVFSSQNCKKLGGKSSGSGKKMSDSGNRF